MSGDTVVRESERRAIRILVDEAEAYLSVVGNEEQDAEKIRWAIARATALVVRTEPRP